MDLHVKIAVRKFGAVLEIEEKIIGFGRIPHLKRKGNAVGISPAAIRQFVVLAIIRGLAATAQKKKEDDA